MAEENPFSALRQGAQPAQVKVNPFASLGVPQAATPTPAVETEEREGERPSIVGEFAKGVVSAPLQIFRGVGELGALAFDSTLDTDYVQEVSDAFDVAEEFVGRPETTGGEITRDLLAFGLGFAPIAGWLGRAGLVAKTGKGFGGPSKFMQSAEAFGKTKTAKAILGNRAKVLGTTALAGGVYDGIISTDGRSTLSDNFEFLPDALKTEADTGLTGREEAFRQFRNRARQAAESTALGASFDAALLGLGRGSKALGELPVIGDALSITSRGVMQGWERVGSVVGTIPGAQPAKQTLRRYFSPGGGVDPKLRQDIADVTGLKAEKAEAISAALFNYTKVSEKITKLSAKKANRSDLTARINTDINRYIDMPVGNSLADNYGKEIQDAADELVLLGTQIEDILLESAEQIAKESPTVSGVSGIPEGIIARGSQRKKHRIL